MKILTSYSKNLSSKVFSPIPTPDESNKLWYSLKDRNLIEKVVFKSWFSDEKPHKQIHSLKKLFIFRLAQVQLVWLKNQIFGPSKLQMRKTFMNWVKFVINFMIYKTKTVIKTSY